jgi:hypothetical protein
MTGKLEMYRKFANALIIGVALSLGWITFEVRLLQLTEHHQPTVTCMNLSLKGILNWFH